jgi:hypothetical protein
MPWLDAGAAGGAARRRISKRDPRRVLFSRQTQRDAAVAQPVRLHHLRQAQADDVEEAAQQSAEQRHRHDQQRRLAGQRLDQPFHPG